MGYINGYAVDGVKLVFVLLRLCIGYTNCYAVVGVTQVFLFTPTTQLSHQPLRGS